MNEELKRALYESLKNKENEELNWQYLPKLGEIAIESKNKNKYQEFIERYYLTPLNVVFKNDEMINRFKYAIVFNDGPQGKTLYFSRKSFLKNIITNIGDLEKEYGKDVYKAIKKPLREKKDIYRDVYKNDSKSKYYKEVLNEYNTVKRNVTFKEYVTLCRQKYTRLLNGYNTVMEFFNKPIDIHKFIDCFSVDQLYLFTCKSIVESNKKSFRDSKTIEKYIDFIKDIRNKDHAYNCHINYKNQSYTIDDLIKEIEE